MRTIPNSSRLHASRKCSQRNSITTPGGCHAAYTRKKGVDDNHLLSLSAPFSFASPRRTPDINPGEGGFRHIVISIRLFLLQKPRLLKRRGFLKTNNYKLKAILRFQGGFSFGCGKHPGNLQIFFGDFFAKASTGRNQFADNHVLFKAS